MSKFRMAVTCPECGELIISDNFMVDFTTVEDEAFPSGIPVIDLSLFACERFDCKKCSTTVWTNDTDNMYDYETKEEEDE